MVEYKAIDNSLYLLDNAVPIKEITAPAALIDKAF